MRYLLIVPLALLFLAGCSKSDRELMNGTWSVQEIKANGETMFTLDKAEQSKVIDGFVKKQMAGLPPEAQAQSAMMKEMFAKQMASVGKTTIEIKEDGSFISTQYDQETPSKVTGKITINEEKKEVNMKSDNDQNFKYEMKDDIMKLTSVEEGGEKLELTFKRK
jgi:hypothetical protein